MWELGSGSSSGGQVPGTAGAVVCEDAMAPYQTLSSLTILASNFLQQAWDNKPQSQGEPILGLKMLCDPPKRLG